MMLNAGDLDWSGLRPRPTTKAASQGEGPSEESDESMVPIEGGESRWRDGALLDDATRSKEGVAIVATLETPTNLRELQRALYLRAKKEPNFRAYALYDKVYRGDVLAHAYALAKANGGAPGPDGQTFEDIETQGREALLNELQEELKTKRYRPGPVRRVYIPKLNGGERPLGIPNIRDRVVQTAAKLLLEPLFEANFEKDSYGFRPKRDAHQALDAVREALEGGMYWVIDADVSAYFDTIPHDKLMKVVARRVVDSAMLALVKMFLEAPILDEREGGGPRRNSRGTPQGGVISPLLANIYLDLLDMAFRKRVERGELQGRIIRYADDFILLSKERPDRAMKWVSGVMERLGLELHPEKTRVLDTRTGEFTFLGHTHRVRFGRVYLDVGKTALGRIRDELRRKTRATGMSEEQLTRELNLYIEGARRYFYRVRRKTLSKLDRLVTQRIARWWARKHSQRRPAWSLVQDWGFHDKYGLKKWYSPWALVPATSRNAR
jgi:RNA-directed DNA polymerase